MPLGRPTTRTVRFFRLISVLPVGDVAVDAVGSDLLAGLEVLPDAVQEDLDLVGLEGDQVADPPDLVVRVPVRPGRAPGVADVVVVGHSLVRAERLPFDRCQLAVGDVLARYVPARREARLVQDDRTAGRRDDAVSRSEE